MSFSATPAFLNAAITAVIRLAFSFIAALLAALLPVERLVEPDRADGVLDQFAVRGMADESVAAAKIVGHWLGFAPALLIAALVAAALFPMDGAAMLRLVLALAIGTPALAGLGVTAAALHAGMRAEGRRIGRAACGESGCQYV